MKSTELPGQTVEHRDRGKTRSVFDNVIVDMLPEKGAIATHDFVWGVFSLGFSVPSPIEWARYSQFPIE